MVDIGELEGGELDPEGDVWWVIGGRVEACRGVRQIWGYCQHCVPTGIDIHFTIAVLRIPSTG